MKFFAGRALDVHDAEGVARRQVGPLADLRDEASIWANVERLARLK